MTNLEYKLLSCLYDIQQMCIGEIAMKMHSSKEKFPTSRLNTILEQRRKQGRSEE